METAGESVYIIKKEKYDVIVINFSAYVIDGFEVIRDINFPSVNRGIYFKKYIRVALKIY